jgi:hypothetical protein
MHLPTFWCDGESPFCIVEFGGRIWDLNKGLASGWAASFLRPSDGICCSCFPRGMRSLHPLLRWQRRTPLLRSLPRHNSNAPPLLGILLLSDAPARVMVGSASAPLTRMQILNPALHPVRRFMWTGVFVPSAPFLCVLSNFRFLHGWGIAKEGSHLLCFLLHIDDWTTSSCDTEILYTHEQVSISFLYWQLRASYLDACHSWSTLFTWCMYEAIKFFSP